MLKLADIETYAPMSDVLPEWFAALAAGVPTPNVLVAGLHGTGKTSIVTHLARQHGMRLLTLNAATIDPFVHLLGIPVVHAGSAKFAPLTNGLEQAELLFVDELNRAPDHVRNALLEVVLTRSINGKPLPKLRGVIAAVNPCDLYVDTVELDFALLDRFPLRLQAPVSYEASNLMLAGLSDHAATSVARHAERWLEPMKGRMRDLIDDNDAAGALAAYASPRTVTEAVRMYATSDVIARAMFNEQQALVFGVDNLFKLLDGHAPSAPMILGGTIVTDDELEALVETRNVSMLRDLMRERPNDAVLHKQVWDALKDAPPVLSVAVAHEIMKAAKDGDA